MTSMSPARGPGILLSDHSLVPWLAWGNGSGKARQDPLKSGTLALKSGLRHLDTAQGYNNEKETGKCIAQAGLRPSELWITSKMSLKDGGTNTSPPIKPESIRASVQSSISALGFKPDLYLIHNPFVIEAGKLKEAWKVLEDLKDEGILNSIGVSNFRPQDLEEICQGAKHLPVVNQIEFHPFVLAHIEPVLALHKKYNITTASYGPLSPIIRHPNHGGPLKPILDRIASRLAISPSSVLLLYVKAKGAIAVGSSTDEAHIKDMVALNGPGMDLTTEEVEQIELTGKKVYFRAYDEHMSVDFPPPVGLSA